MVACSREMVRRVTMCADLHARAKSSEREFRGLLEIIGVQRLAGGDLLLGNCPACRTTLSYVIDADMVDDLCPACARRVSAGGHVSLWACAACGRAHCMHRGRRGGRAGVAATCVVCPKRSRRSE